jgi:hypothetical protein
MAGLRMAGGRRPPRGPAARPAGLRQDGASVRDRQPLPGAVSAGGGARDSVGHVGGIRSEAPRSLPGSCSLRSLYHIHW